MANRDGATGLRPVRHYGGGVVRANEYSIASGLASNIFFGDAVKSLGTGNNITVAAAGDTLLGSFAGTFYQLASGGEPVWSPYWPANTVLLAGTEAQAMVFDDPMIVFEIQASAAFAAGDLGALSDLLANAGDIATGISRFELDSGQIAVGGADQLKILRLAARPDNELGVNAKLEVLINQHELRAGLLTGV